MSNLFDVYNIRKNCDKVLTEVEYSMIEDFLTNGGIPYSHCVVVGSGQPVTQFKRS